MRKVHRAPSLEQYADDCRRLAADIEGILEDVEFQINGHEIRYAIDFAEIHAYIDPEPSEFEELKVFPDDDLLTCWAIQNAVVNLLLFGMDSNPILLPPYAAELEGYLNWSEGQPARALARSLERALEEATRIRQSDGATEIAKVINDLRERPDAVSDEEKDKVFRYVEDNATNLTVLVQSGQNRPRHVLIELLRRRPFDDLAARDIAAGRLEMNALPLNEETAERWEQELSRRRRKRPGASYRDAYVMMLLEAVDIELSGTATKVCLVTRSSHMHEAFEQDLAGKRWKGPRGRVLRHPRSFIAAAASSPRDLHAIKKRLQDQLTSIQAFLSIVASLADIAPVEAGSTWAPLYELVREDREKAWALLEAIKRDWRRLVSLAAAEAGAAGVGSDRGDGHTSRLDVVAEVFRAVHDPGALHSHVRDRITELVRTINFNYQYVTALEGRALSREGVAEDVRAAVEGDAITIDASYVPYTMAFHSPHVLAWSHHLRQQRRVDPGEILRLFEQGFASGHTYEPLLAIAFLFAAWDRWSVARDYAALAIAARVEDDPPPVEGQLFKALCLRIAGGDSRASYEDAMELLADAIVGTGGRDPRVLVEKAVQGFYWSFHFPEDGAKVTEANRLTDEVIEMLRDRHDEEATNLKIRAHNNRCFYLLQFDDESSHRRAADDLRCLLDLLRSREPEQTTWRPQVLDTVLWAEWRLDGGRLSNDGRERLRKRLLAQYEDLLARDLRKSSRALINDHLEAIRSTASSV